MKHLFIIILFFVSFFSVQAQHLAAFNDNLNKFWVFEAGMFNKLEHIEIEDYQVGGILVAYIDRGSNLKIYRNGEVETLTQGAPIIYEATDYLLGYSIYEQLNVYDNGNNQVLSTQCDGYIIQDSIIVWRNRVDQTINIYYDGNVILLEDGLIYSPIEELRAGDNILAYIQNSTQEFKVFYLGETHVLDQSATQMIYKAGRDIVAYVNVFDQEFNVFYKGEEIKLEDFQPKSFQVGDDRLAYVDNMNRLKYFEKGNIITLSTYEPKFYEVTDNVVVFEEQGFFKTYCNGQIYIVERFIPQPYKIDFNSIAYLDQSRFLKFYNGCESITINYEKTREISVIRDLVIFVQGVNKPKVYFNGQIYEYY